MQTKTILDHAVIAAQKEHQLNLLVKLTAPQGKKEQKRRPLNLGVVIDRSGSMQGEKLDYAKQAEKLLVSHLAENDLLSIVLFDTDVETFMEPSADKDKDGSKNAVDHIVAGSSTNLSGGRRCPYRRLATKGLAVLPEGSFGRTQHRTGVILGGWLHALSIVPIAAGNWANRSTMFTSGWMRCSRSYTRNTGRPGIMPAESRRSERCGATALPVPPRSISCAIVVEWCRVRRTRRW